MSFQPAPNDELNINNVSYRIAEHPAAPGIPYGQEGRAGIVYQLCGSTNLLALKVFKPTFRSPTLVGHARQIAPFAALPGLRSAQRMVLTPREYDGLLRQYPDLLYALLMPWITGPTWQEVLLERTPLRPATVLTLARALATTLAALEEQGLAHGDLSGANILLPHLAGQSEHAVELVDLEGMYLPGMPRPANVLSGSAGYGHPTVVKGAWGPELDRFAGAILLTELLGWCDERVRAAAWGESYFAPDEIQRSTQRAAVLTQVLHERWGMTVSTLWTQAWQSPDLYACPSFGEWLVAMPLTVPEEGRASRKSNEDRQVAVRQMETRTEHQEQMRRMPCDTDQRREVYERVSSATLDRPVAELTGRTADSASTNDGTRRKAFSPVSVVQSGWYIAVLVILLIVSGGIGFVIGRGQITDATLSHTAVPTVAAASTIATTGLDTTPSLPPSPTTYPPNLNASGGLNVVSETPSQIIEIRPAPDALAFAQTSLSLPANLVVRLVFVNQNNLGVQHNWVLVNGGDDVAAAVNTAAQNNADALFVPPPDTPNALAWTAMINAGGNDSVTFRVPSPGTYRYICTFPGRYLAGMEGSLTVTP